MEHSPRLSVIGVFSLHARPSFFHTKAGMKVHFGQEGMETD
jgi:hypothetical protein